MEKETDKLSADERIDALIDAAIESAVSIYLSAVALQYLGRSSDSAWRRFAGLTARSMVLSVLEGMGEAYETAIASGFVPPVAPSVTASQIQQIISTHPVLTTEGADIAIGDGITVSVKGLQVGPFEEAIRAFDERVPRLADEVRRASEFGARTGEAIMQSERQEAMLWLSRRQRFLRRSFFVTGADLEQTMAIRSEIARVLAAAASKRPIPTSEFIDAADARAAVGLSRARMETVMRNAITGAHADGRMTIAERPATRKMLPLIEINEIRDLRTRGNPNGLYPDRGKHFQMHGYTNTPAEIDRQGLRPPAGHNCRGGLRNVGLAEAMSRGLCDDDGNVLPEAVRRYNGERQAIVDRGEYPDPGFR